MSLTRWRKLADRVKRMERKELRDRIRQEFAKRQDGLLFHLRFDFARSQRQRREILLRAR
jgi:hypothetical protein